MQVLTIARLIAALETVLERNPDAGTAPVTYGWDAAPVAGGVLARRDGAPVLNLAPHPLDRAGRILTFQPARRPIMADYYVQASLAFDCSPDEAALILETARAATAMSHGDPPAAPIAALLDAFRPTDPGEPWSGLRAAFPDPDWPSAGADIDAEARHDDPPRWRVWIASMDGFEPETVAMLIQRCCRAALAQGPIGFTWAATCSKPRVDEFGGGWCAVFPDRIEFETSHQRLSEALTSGI